MAAVNPELADRSDLTDHERVKALFGSSPRVLLRAVGEFLKKEPGTLDHHNLRIIAAAAPHMGDPQLVAQLIDRLPITKMQIAAKPLDLESARQTFAKILPNYSNKSRRALVADLVRETTVHVATFAPPERVTPEGRKVVEAHLLDLLRGTQQDQTRAIASRFVTQRVIDAALDRVERRIDASARGSTNRPPSRLPLMMVASTFIEVLNMRSDAITSEHVERAWGLIRRCEFDDWTGSVVTAGSRNPYLNEATALSIFDFMKVEGELGSCNELLNNSAVPETLARRIVNDVRINFQGADKTNCRLGILRLHHYSARSNQEHGADEPELLPSMSSDELDLQLASLPKVMLQDFVIRAMRSEEALRVVADRFSEFDQYERFALLLNRHTSRAGLLAVCENPDTWRFPPGTTGLDKKIDQTQRFLLADDRLTDEDLERIVRSIPDPYSRDAVLNVAVKNRSAGALVLGCVVESERSGLFLRAFAESTPSPEIQLELSRLAKRIDESENPDRDSTILRLRNGAEIAEKLASNGTLRSEVADELATWFEPRKTDWIRTRSPRTHGVPCSYDEVDVARLAVDGVVTRDRVDTLVMQAVDLDTNFPEEAKNAVRLLADAGLLTDSHWQQMTGHVDDHIALDFATHPLSRQAASAITTLAEKKLADTETALAAGNPLPDDIEPTKWSDLPGLLDVPFPETPAAKLIDGQVVSGRKLVVLKTARALHNVADELGNCLKGYEDNVRAGTSLVATTDDDPDVMVAVSWDTDPSDGRNTRVREMNTRFNRGNVPDEFAAGVRAMTDELLAGTLQPVENVQPEVVTELPETTANADERQGAYVRVPRGRRPLHLHVAQPEDADQRAVPAPHVLAARGDGELTVDTDPNIINDMPGRDHTDGQATPEIGL